jgi:hypothetical protein
MVNPLQFFSFNFWLLVENATSLIFKQEGMGRCIFEQGCQLKVASSGLVLVSWVGFHKILPKTNQLLNF